MGKILKIIAGLLMGLLLAGGVAVGYLYFVAGGSVAVPEAVRNWFPSSGNGGTVAIPQTNSDGTLETPTENLESLRLLSRNPVAGAVLIGEGAAAYVRFVERETGNIFEIPAAGGESVRLTNTTIPRIQEGSFTSNGAAVALRYLAEDNHTIETFLGILPTQEEEGVNLELGGSFMPQNTLSVTARPSGATFFYLTRNGTGALGFTRTPQSTTESTVFASEINEWNPRWVSEGTVTLTTKPSANVPGYFYLLNISSETLTHVLGGIPGLTANLRPDGQQVVFSESEADTLRMVLLDLDSGEAQPLPVTTLPEKCVWGQTDQTKLFCGVPRTLPEAAYPDAWYRGEFFFSDDIWVIDTVDGSAEFLVNLSELAGGEVDLIEPQISADDRFLVFRNKNDGSLWSFQLPETPQQ